MRRVRRRTCWPKPSRLAAARRSWPRARGSPRGPGPRIRRTPRPPGPRSASQSSGCRQPTGPLGMRAHEGRGWGSWPDFCPPIVMCGRGTFRRAVAVVGVGVNCNILLLLIAIISAAGACNAPAVSLRIAGAAKFEIAGWDWAGTRALSAVPKIVISTIAAGAFPFGAGASDTPAILTDLDSTKATHIPGGRGVAFVC